MENTVFLFTSYRAFISHKLAENQKRGMKSDLAKSVGCHLAYISQVLKGATHFTLEQASGICKFFSLNEDETDYFILLVSFERSGTEELRKYYQRKIAEILAKRAKINSRLKVDKELTSEEENKYYSSWYYIAIDVLTSIPNFQTVENISKYLKIDSEYVSKYLYFLTQIGVVKKNGERFEVGTTRMHLSPTSHLISKHHTNWRIKAISSMESPKQDSLHFSTVYSFSKSDQNKLKEMILKLVENMEPLILESPAEIAYCFSFDFFQV